VETTRTTLVDCCKVVKLQLRLVDEAEDEVLGLNGEVREVELPLWPVGSGASERSVIHLEDMEGASVKVSTMMEEDDAMGVSG